MCKTSPLLLLLLLGGVLCAPTPAASELPTLEQQLRLEAGKLIAQAQANNWHNLGVLRFRGRREGNAFTDNVGTLNGLLSVRLERALLLANDPEPERTVGLIRNASATAARTRGANHLTPAGRRILFQSRYPLLWGEEQVLADAFVTGRFTISKDLRSALVELFVFSRQDMDLQRFSQFTVRNQADKLVEMGADFLQRGLVRSQEDLLTLDEEDSQALGLAGKVNGKQVRHPLQDPARLIDLEIHYGGKRVPLVFRDGKAHVVEPEEKDHVVLTLTHRNQSKERLGVVLKVNGISTLYQERQPDLACQRWILGPNDRYPIQGYQRDGHRALPFRVLARRESKEKEIDYGDNVGTVTLSVFREQTVDELPPVALGPGQRWEEEHLRSISTLAAPARTPRNFHLAKLEALRKPDLTHGLRGLLVPGTNTLETHVAKESFRADPIPVMVATVIYYKR